MAQLFLTLYDFFHDRKTLFWSFFFSIVLILSLGASQIRLEEDISKFFPDDERVEKLNLVLQHSKFVERLVIMVSNPDSASAPQPDSLVIHAEELIARIEEELKPYVKKVSSSVDDEKILEVFKTVYDNLPIFLNDQDYVQLDSLSQPEVVKEVLQENYHQLISPAGIAIKKIIVEDPLGFSFLALRKLQQLQYDENFELYDNYIITRDHRHLVFFVQPVYPPSETGNNSKFIASLNSVINKTSENHAQIKTSYFGAAAVAVGNAEQLRKDTILTVSVLTILLAVFLIGFFRKKRVPFLILIPVAFGGLFSICCIYVLKGSVSILALAAGSVILGIAVNYSLHFLTHLRHTHDIKLVIKDLTSPMIVGSTTTILAFFCLQFANASVLRDVGLFAAFSLIGAALCSLVFLPHFLPEKLFSHADQGPNWIEQISLSSTATGRSVVWIILLFTPVFFYFARQVNFNSDVSRLNFMQPNMLEAQSRLESITKSSLGTIYVVSDGSNLEDALRKTEQVIPQLQKLKASNKINKYSSLTTFLISDSLQQLRIQKWNSFWTPLRKSGILSAVAKESSALKFSPQIFNNFERLIAKQYKPADPKSFNSIRYAFFDDYIIERDNTTTVISLVNVDPQRKAEVYRQLEDVPAHAFDRQMLTNLFVEYVNADFNFIVTFTAILVFTALFLSYGRIELTLITFVPMFITWIWILGIMALLDIEFNIVNVMVSTFIFGLGDDYSIFIMDALQQDYRTGKKNIQSVQMSIFLSALTTIAGLGVLIFARHPALRSIASISIIGIVCVFIMSQTIEPFLFRVLISNRTRRGFTPMTWAGILRTTFTYSFFVIGAIFMTIVGLVFKIIPFWKKKIRFVYHAMLSYFTWALIYVDPRVSKIIIGKTSGTFSQAGILIANHTSFLDILLTTMLDPKLILLTNKWVWNSPVFGGVVRLADYYPVTEGAEESVAGLKDRVQEGYSVVVFPEGKRSEDGKLNRFHKGAFYLAEALAIRIQPLLIHGAADAIPKGSFYLNEGQLTLKFLDPIEANDTRYGANYVERTKSISKYFKQEYARLTSEIETPEYFAHRLITNYIYKGPILEWYLRVKIKLEKNYEPFHKLLPLKGIILDLGCGYGFLCYMLQFLSNERTIIGVDYDEDKIDTANHGYLRSDRLRFHYADVTQFPLEKYDAIIISDVLHYLKPDDQERLLKRVFKALNTGGKLIIREGNCDLKRRHRGTQLTEFFSVKLLKFNKSLNPMYFVSGESIKKIAASYGMGVEILDDAKFTSNVIFVVQKNA